MWRARPGGGHAPFALSHLESVLCGAFLYGRAGRLAAQNGGFRPGQQRVLDATGSADSFTRMPPGPYHGYPGPKKKYDLCCGISVVASDQPARAASLAEPAPNAACLKNYQVDASSKPVRAATSRANTYCSSCLSF